MRDLAGWPDAIDDPRLQPHLDGATREFKAWVGAERYDVIAALEDENDDKETAKEIIACLAIAYATPALHQFVLTDGPNVPKAIEELDFQFLTPEQAKDFAAGWRERAKERFDGWTPPKLDDEDEAEPNLVMEAI